MTVAMKSAGVSNHAEAIDWSNVSADINAQGWAILPNLLAAKECDAITGLYDKREGRRIGELDAGRDAGA